MYVAARLECYAITAVLNEFHPCPSHAPPQVAATHTMYSTEFTEEKFASYVSTYTTGDEMVFIRPSGNPMDMKGFKGMWSSGMITEASSELVSVDTIRFAGLLSCWPKVLPAPIGAVCVVTYTSHDKFKFQGNENDDIAKFSAVLEKSLAGGWHICHVHRATGQTPT